jgi:hypothetical protein
MNSDEHVVHQSDPKSRDLWNLSRIAEWPQFRLYNQAPVIVGVQFAVMFGLFCVLSTFSACEPEHDRPSMLLGRNGDKAVGFFASVQTHRLGRPCEPPGFECGPEFSCTIGDPVLGNECAPFGLVGVRHDCGRSELCMWGATCAGVCVEQVLLGSDREYPWHCRDFSARVPNGNYPKFCQSRCDPFVPFDCEGSCVLGGDGIGEGFHCSFGSRSLAESCGYTYDVCDTGLVCAEAEELGDFCGVRDLGCCTRVCDLSLPDPNAACLGLGEVDTCLPIFDDPVDEWEARLGKCVAVP